MNETKEVSTSSVFSGIMNPMVTKPTTFTKENLGIPIKITLDINIGGKSEKVPFTSSLLYLPPPEEPKKSLLQLIPEPTVKNPINPAKDVIPDIPLETYPRIPTQNIALPAQPLKQLRYKEVVQFFFNKKVFAQKMQLWNTETKFNLTSAVENFFSIGNTSEETQEETQEEATFQVSESASQRPSYLLSEREVEIIRIEKENIELMLHLLFPTYAFHTEGYKTSMQYWNPSEPYLKNTFPKTQFSYIRHHGTIYTISNAVWLNDVFNVPFYRDLIKYYEMYKEWKTERIQHFENEKARIDSKKKRVGEDENQLKALEKELSTIEQVILLLQKGIMEKKEVDDLFVKKKYYDVSKKWISISPSQIKNPLYFYSLLFSKQSERILSYSNERLNDIIYNDSPTLTNKNIDKNTEKNNRDKELLEQMMENILDYAIHKGKIQYMARGICPKEEKTNCHSSKEISTFYYTGILHQTRNRSEPSYEIYVLMDVIAGEVNQKNVGGIKCQYENQSIGKKLEYLTGQWPAWDLSNRRIFMKLDAKKEELPLVSKTLLDSSSTVSLSLDEKGEKRNINADIQKRIEKWIEFDKTQSEKKFKNAVEKINKDIQTYKNQSYMQKVKLFDWTLDSPDKDIFLKWLQNPNKYPSPAEKETNDAYVAIDRKIYLFLEKMEVLFQSKIERTNKIRDITNIVEQISDLLSNVTRIIETNESKISSPQWKYVKIIMEFYTGLLSFLMNFLEFKKRKYQQEGSDLTEGGSGEYGIEGAVENNWIDHFVFTPVSQPKTLKHTKNKKPMKKKRFTRKSG